MQYTKEQYVQAIRAADKETTKQRKLKSWLKKQYGGASTFLNLLLLLREPRSRYGEQVALPL